MWYGHHQTAFNKVYKQKHLTSWHYKACMYVSINFYKVQDILSTLKGQLIYSV